MTFDYTFDDETGHLTITVGSTKIPKKAFSKESQVKSISIPDSVTSIGERAFNGASITDIVIPHSLVTIG